MTGNSLLPGLLRSLARELDAEAESCATACTCEGHFARQTMANDLAAVYRTRALRYEADPMVAARSARENALIVALDALSDEARISGGGVRSSRSLFAAIARVLNAHEACVAARRVGA